MTRQELGNKGHRPFLHRLRKYRVVGERISSNDNIPGIVPLETFLVDQDTLQFDDAQGRVSI